MPETIELAANGQVRTPKEMAEIKEMGAPPARHGRQCTHLFGCALCPRTGRRISTKEMACRQTRQGLFFGAACSLAARWIDMALSVALQPQRCHVG